MKSFCIAIVAMLLCFSCKQESKTNSIALSGTIHNASEDSIFFYDLSGQKTAVPLDEEGRFLTNIPLNASTYYGLYSHEVYIPLYLNQSELSIHFDAVKGKQSITFEGEFAEQNKYLLTKDSMRLMLGKWDTKSYSMDSESYYETAKSEKQRLDSLLISQFPSDSDFTTQEQKENDYLFALSLYRYPSAHRMFTKDSVGMPSKFESYLTAIDFDNEEEFTKSKAYQNLVYEKSYEIYDKVEEGNLLEEITNYIKSHNSPSIKDALAESLIAQDMMPGSKDLDEKYSLLKELTASPEKIKEFTQKYNQAKSLAKGAVSPSFEYENYEGGTTSLEDLKGKYVYIDVWATWCGPCLAEIPHLKEVEELFYDKNIEFVSISVDAPKQYEAWKTMVKEKNLGGVQLFADHSWESSFVKQYLIEGIPRFILIDPAGNIVSADAPRPSSEELKELLSELEL